MQEREGGAVHNRLREARRAAGWSQGDLAARAGVTRQTIGALEAGLYAPTMAVALRLARALGREVGALFWLADERPAVPAELLPGMGPAGDAPLRVQVARVGGRTLARPAGAYAPADGLVAAPPGAEHPYDRVLVELLTAPEVLDASVVVLGCDPALATLAAHLGRRHPGLRLIADNAGSLAALAALARGEAHVAGMHLRDQAAGEYNLPFVRRAFAGRHVAVVTAAHWEQGLIVAAGNPRGIAGAADLARPDLAIVNREAGAGSRAALDQALGAAGVAPAAVRGYDRTVGSHAAVAEVVAAGLADAGPGIRAAAAGRGLGFVPLVYERYDLVIPGEHRDAAPVQALLDTLASPGFRADLAALPGYDASRTGSVVLDERV
ncbi:MAG TPA: substrate-binding domain-containing protein [Thermomicrobiales bacterium]|nr:substrate-binding domain-containing protein [Thermomicrobiales bacterium]